MAQELTNTVPIFIAALFAMLEFEALAVAQSVAYRHLAGLKKAA